MTKERIERAIEIIDYAIKNNVSVTKASELCGFAGSYVKNIRIVLNEKYENGQIEDEVFSTFSEKYSEYLKAMSSSVSSLPSAQDELDSFKQKWLEAINIGSGGQIKYEENGDKGEITWRGGNYPPNHIKTAEELMKVAKVDTKVWRIKNYLVNKWDVTAWKSGTPQTIENFQVKVWLERIDSVFKAIQSAEVFQNMIKNYTAPKLNLPLNKYKSVDIDFTGIENENNLFELSIFDLHIGKLAWGGETGENYDTKIASKRFLKAITSLIYRASAHNFDRIVFPVGSDFFNTDNLLNTTTKGTPQDEDLRWQKTFEVGAHLLVDGINMLLQTGAPVDVVVIPGNHDFQRSFYVGAFLQAWFRDNPMVNINNHASPRKYYRFGEVLLGFTHGSEEKEASLPMLMATEAASKQSWSETTFHEWHIGHIHRKRNVNYTVLDKTRTLNEDLGVTVRYLSSLTGTEEWHHKKGFVGQIKAADGFIWNDKTGLIAHLNANVLIEDGE
jgi:hypothetical protein